MGGVFFRDAAADAATRQSATAEKVRPHPQYCRRVWGKEGNATLAHGLTHVNYQTLIIFGKVPPWTLILIVLSKAKFQ